MIVIIDTIDTIDTIGTIGGIEAIGLRVGRGGVEGRLRVVGLEWVWSRFGVGLE